MNTYIKCDDNLTTNYAAIRATKKEIEQSGLNLTIVPASSVLRKMTIQKLIPTYRIIGQGKLGLL